MNAEPQLPNKLQSEIITFLFFWGGGGERGWGFLKNYLFSTSRRSLEAELFYNPPPIPRALGFA